MNSREFVLDPWGKQPKLDRQIDQRNDEQYLAHLWSSKQAKIVRIGANGVFDRARLVSDTTGDFDWHTNIFLGIFDSTAWFASFDSQPIKHPGSVRDENLQGVPRDVVVTATAILAWHQSTKFCDGCGGVLQADVGGFSMSCINSSCRKVIFPRHDPAMIVAVLDEKDRILLAHQHTWRPRYMSVLAGFLEAGESAEQAVYREVMEEAGLQVKSTRYLGTQPWPFPRSLMISFVARATGDLSIDQNELEYVEWFSRSQVESASSNGELVLPVSGSVASHMIRAWLKGTLPQP